MHEIFGEIRFCDIFEIFSDRCKPFKVVLGGEMICDAGGGGGVVILRNIKQCAFNQI